MYNIEALFFIEDNFFFNKERVRDICEGIKKEKIDIIWGANARVDGIDAEILKIAKEAGCKQITFGFESGSQRILDVLNKEASVEQNRIAIELCRQAGIIPQGTVMIGNPTETIEDVRATQQFIKDTNLKSVGVSITTAYPGTKLWEWCEERDLIPQKLDWANFDYEKIPIRACNTIPVNKIEMLRLETLFIININREGCFAYLRLLWKVIANPIYIIKILTGLMPFKMMLQRLITKKKNR